MTEPENEEVYTPPADGSLYCPLCDSVLGDAFSPVSVLKEHYQTTHPETDQWPKDDQGLPVLSGYSEATSEPGEPFVEPPEEEPEP